MQMHSPVNAARPRRSVSAAAQRSTASLRGAGAASWASGVVVTSQRCIVSAQQTAGRLWLAWLWAGAHLSGARLRPRGSSFPPFLLSSFPSALPPASCRNGGSEQGW